MPIPSLRPLALCALVLASCQVLSSKKDGSTDAIDDEAAAAAVVSTLTVDRADGIVADGNDKVAIDVGLKEADGRPVVGAVVRVTATGTGNLVQRGVATTGVDGMVHALLLSTVAEAKTVTVTAYLGHAERPVGEAHVITFVAGVPARLAFLGMPAGIQAGAPFGSAVAVTVADAHGNPVTSLNPTITLSTFDNTPLGGTLQLPASDGKAVFADARFLRPSQSSELIARADGLVDGRSTVFSVGLGSNSSLTTDVASVAADGQSAAMATATLVDAQGGGLPGIPVTWQAQGGTAVIAALAAQTDQSGKIVARVSGGTAGSVTIVAIYPGGRLSAPLTLVVPPPRIPDVTTSTIVASPVSVTANGSSAVGVKVTVRDAHGLPVARQAVDLTATGTGNMLSPTHASTGTTGLASFAVRSTVAEAKHISASFAGLTLSVDVSFVPRPCTTTVQFTRTHLAAGATTMDGASADIDGDGRVDLVVANYGSGTVSVLRGRGDGTFLSATTLAVDPTPAAVLALDLDGDNHSDVVATSLSGAHLEVLRNDGTGVLTLAAPRVAGTASPLGAAAIDVNKDGRLDVVTAVTQAASIDVFLSPGDGTLAAPVNYAVALDPQAVAGGDLDGDGFPELAVASGGSQALSVLHNRGDGTFDPMVTYPTSLRPRWVGLRDLDGDGKLDMVAVANDEANGSSSGLVITLRGDGQGGFGAAVTRPIAGTPWGAAVADFNYDGHPDLMVAAHGSDSALLLVGRGDGTFNAATLYATDAAPATVIAADFDADGRIDAALPSASGAGGVTVLLSTSCSP